nr:unnamed protein product [Callosobruchus analis]
MFSLDFTDFQESEGVQTITVSSFLMCCQKMSELYRTSCFMPKKNLPPYEVTAIIAVFCGCPLSERSQSLRTGGVSSV